MTKPFQPPIPVREVSLVSYRPQARQQTIQYLAKTIRPLVELHLSTRKLKKEDMEVIGV